MNVDFNRRKKFQPYEDYILTNIMRMNPSLSWPSVASFLPGRTARQCRDRWVNFLNPSIQKRAWTKEDDELLLSKFIEFGQKWSKILQFFPNTSYSDLKNRFYTKILKQKGEFQQMGSVPLNSEKLLIHQKSQSLFDLIEIGEFPCLECTDV